MAAQIASHPRCAKPWANTEAGSPRPLAQVDRHQAVSDRSPSAAAKTPTALATTNSERW
jgi:hypothetical protein